MLKSKHLFENARVQVATKVSFRRFGLNANLVASAILFVFAVVLIVLLPILLLPL